MRLYLDICCIKRPFDDQAQPRIALETTALHAILHAARTGRAVLLRSSVLDVENNGNTNPERAAAVREFLAGLGPPELTPEAVLVRARAARDQGLGPYDALHLAWAEHLGADMLVTVDDVFARRAQRIDPPPRVRVVDPLACIKEIGP